MTRSRNLITLPEAREGPEWENTKVALHEAAHAVLFWNLGFGVQRIWIDRVRHCGHAEPCRSIENRMGRLGNAVACVAGLAAQSYLEDLMQPADVWRSFTDFGLALPGILATEPLTDGEQLGLAIALTRRTVVLVQEPEVKSQIYSLVPPLLKNGALLQRQVNTVLAPLPETREAKRKCREFVDALSSERAEMIESVRGHAPEFRWTGPS